MEERVLRARYDDADLERLVNDNKSFILRCASKTCRRFITDGDDEYEVAILAFREAVRTYNPSAGGFNAFAFLVIRRRLMDFFDKQSRHAGEIPIGYSMTWEDERSDGVIAEVQKKIVREEDPMAVKDEIEALGDVLREYGFSFFDLAEASPKAAKTKKCCARAVNWMLETVERIIRMRKKRSLPVKAISKALDIALKILERYRRYIIAATEILDGDYPHLAEYLKYIKEG